MGGGGRGDKINTMGVHSNWAYIFDSLICNFITVQHALLIYYNSGS